MTETFYFLEYSPKGKNDWFRHRSDNYDTLPAARRVMLQDKHGNFIDDFRIVRRVVTDTVVE